MGRKRKQEVVAAVVRQSSRIRERQQHQPVNVINLVPLVQSEVVSPPPPVPKQPSSARPASRQASKLQKPPEKRASKPIVIVVGPSKSVVSEPKPGPSRDIAPEPIAMEPGPSSMIPGPSVLVPVPMTQSVMFPPGPSRSEMSEAVAKVLSQSSGGWQVKRAIMSYHKLVTETVPTLNRNMLLTRTHNEALLKTLLNSQDMESTLTAENSRLRSLSEDYKNISERERYRSQDAWRSLETKSLYDRTTSESATQRYFLQQNYEKAIDEVKTHCDQRLKDIEYDRASLAKQNEYLNRKLKNFKNNSTKIKSDSKDYKSIIQVLSTLIPTDKMVRKILNDDNLYSKYETAISNHVPNKVIKKEFTEIKKEAKTEVKEPAPPLIIKTEKLSPEFKPGDIKSEHITPQGSPKTTFGRFSPESIPVPDDQVYETFCPEVTTLGNIFESQEFEYEEQEFEEVPDPVDQLESQVLEPTPLSTIFKPEVKTAIPSPSMPELEIEQDQTFLSSPEHDKPDLDNMFGGLSPVNRDATGQLEKYIQGDTSNENTQQSEQHKSPEFEQTQHNTKVGFEEKQQAILPTFDIPRPPFDQSGEPRRVSGDEQMEPDFNNQRKSQFLEEIFSSDSQLDQLTQPTDHREEYKPMPLISASQYKPASQISADQQYKSGSQTSTDPHQAASQTIADNRQHESASQTLADPHQRTASQAPADQRQGRRYKTVSQTPADPHQYKAATQTFADKRQQESASQTLADPNQRTASQAPADQYKPATQPDHHVGFKLSSLSDNRPYKPANIPTFDIPRERPAFVQSGEPRRVSGDEQEPDFNNPLLNQRKSQFLEELFSPASDNQLDQTDHREYKPMPLTSSSQYKPSSQTSADKRQYKTASHTSTDPRQGRRYKTASQTSSDQYQPVTQPDDHVAFKPSRMSDNRPYKPATQTTASAEYLAFKATQSAKADPRGYNNQAAQTSSAHHRAYKPPTQTAHPRAYKPPTQTAHPRAFKSASQTAVGHPYKHPTPNDQRHYKSSSQPDPPRRDRWIAHQPKHTSRPMPRTWVPPRPVVDRGSSEEDNFRMLTEGQARKRESTQRPESSLPKQLRPSSTLSESSDEDDYDIAPYEEEDKERKTPPVMLLTRKEIRTRANLANSIAPVSTGPLCQKMKLEKQITESTKKKDNMEQIFGKEMNSERKQEFQFSEQTSESDDDADDESSSNVFSSPPASPEPAGAGLQTTQLVFNEDLDAEVQEQLKAYIIGDDPTYFRALTASVLFANMYVVLCEVGKESSEVNVNELVSQCPLIPSYHNLLSLMNNLQGFKPAFISYLLENILLEDTRREFENNVVLPNFGRLVPCLINDRAEKVDFFIKFGLYRPRLFHDFAYGFLCSDATILGYNGIDNGVVSRALMILLVKSPRFFKSKHFNPIRNLVCVSLNLEIPDITYEQFVLSVVNHMKTIETQNQLDQFEVLLALLVVHAKVQYFYTTFTAFIVQFLNEWKNNEIHDGAFATFINSLGMISKFLRRGDAPSSLAKQINIVQTIRNIPNLSPYLMTSLNKTLETMGGVKLRTQQRSPRGGDPPGANKRKKYNKNKARKRKRASVQTKLSN